MPRAKKEKKITNAYDKFAYYFYEETYYQPTEYIRRQLKFYTVEQIEEFYGILCDLISYHYNGRLFTFKEVYEKYLEEEKEKMEQATRALEMLAAPSPSICQSVFCVRVRT